MTLRLLTILFAAIQQPEFTTEHWPGEGRPVFATVASRIQLHSQPSGTALVVDALVLPAGTRIRFDETRFATIRSGLITFDKPGVIAGRLLGRITYLSRQDYYTGRFPQDTLYLPAGAQVAYLQYRAELTCFVRVGADVVDAHPCPGTRRDSARVVREPQLEWWVRILIDGWPGGWALVSDSTLRQVDRQF